MKKGAFLALAVVTTVGGCSGEREAHRAERLPTDGVTAAQVRAFEQLESETRQSWRWLQHEELKTPMHLSAPRTGSAVLAPNADVVETTIELLSAHKALFKMRDPSVELSVRRAEIDELGMTHARFQQLTHGVPVFGAELMAHYDAHGRLTSIDANYVPGLESVDVNPALVTSEALAKAKADVLARSVVAEEELEPNAGELLVFARKGTPARLAYQFEVRALAAETPAIWIVTVDAKTGDVLHRYDDLQTIEGEGVGVLGDKKPIEVTAAGGGYVMRGTVDGVMVRTYTAEQQQVIPGEQVTSNSLTSWDTGVPGAGAAVDAHYHASAVLKYYKEKFDRNSIDGNGGALISTAHFGRAFDNAAWDGTGMIYGDGGQLFLPLSVGVDVVGHEFTHGITQRTSNLIYENQSGALNEAVSDIFSAFIERFVSPDDTKNWLLGEVVTKDGTPLRNMRQPGAGLSRQPAHMDQFVNTQQDNGGVHINSGIINNAAYLMTMGGTNPVSKVNVKYGIGWEKSEQLWYRANTRYFLRRTNFGQAAQAVFEAAKDIGLTEVETDIVDCAFKATGLVPGECAPITIDPQAPPQEEEEEEVLEETPVEADVDEEVEEQDVAPKRRRPRRLVTREVPACAATPGAPSSGGAALLVAGALLALGRRRRAGRGGSGT